MSRRSEEKKGTNEKERKEGCGREKTAEDVRREERKGERNE